VEVRITDISVSRVHSLIRMTKRGEVILQDNESKFGTLLLMANPYSLKGCLPMFVQVGRTFLCFQAQKSYSCWKSCLCG